MCMKGHNMSKDVSSKTILKADNSIKDKFTISKKTLFWKRIALFKLKILIKSINNSKFKFLTFLIKLKKIFKILKTIKIFQNWLKLWKTVKLIKDKIKSSRKSKKRN